MAVQNLDTLSWIDLTSAAMLLVFLVLGFFRGFLWQMSRLASLLLAWFLANQFHPGLTTFFEEKLGLFQEADYGTYVSFFVIFLGTLVILSLLTMIIEKFVEKLHLTFYNRVGGGVLGVFQGVGLLLAMVGLVYFVFPESALAKQVATSRTGRATRAVVSRLDGILSEDLLILYGLRERKQPVEDNQLEDDGPLEEDGQTGEAEQRSPVPVEASSERKDD